MPVPLTLYSATVCDDSDRTRLCLQELGYPFQEVNIDRDRAAEQFVIFVNNGYRSTPTLVLGTGKRKLILTEPTDAELIATLNQIPDLLNTE